MPGKRKTRWRAIRRLSQASFTFLFIYLAAKSQVPQGFNQTIYNLASNGRDLRLANDIGFFFKLDPLVALSTMFSTWALKPALLISLTVLLCVLVFGRFFCGFVCPFGAVNQVCTQIRPGLKKSEQINRNLPQPAGKIKYYLLLTILAAALFGANLAGVVDPFSLLYRGLALAIFPAFQYLTGLLCSWFAELPNPIAYLSYICPYGFNHVLGYEPRFYQNAFFMGGVLVFLLAINYLKPRFFCRTVCPLGALLGLFSRYGLLNLTKDRSLCTQCGKCQIDCPGACGPHPDQEWLRHECHVCFNCEASCPENALKFKLQLSRPHPSTHGAIDSPDLSRRAVISSLASGAMLLGLSRSGNDTIERLKPNLIRPPGAVEEHDFLKKCVRCGLCMKVCPTNVITPSVSEAGVEGFWTPVMNFHIGYCEYSCTLCGSVCPTGAIRELTASEKIETPVKIGSSFFDLGRCLPWSGQGPCVVCEEHCPVSPKAIYLVPMDVDVDEGRTEVLQVPRRNLERCIGCGLCSYVCPVKGSPAVYVTSIGESRSPGARILLPGSKKNGAANE